MLALRELQRAFAAGLAGQPSDIARLIASGPVSPEDRLRIHRNTMRGALAAALRLSYPVVDALVGAKFFDQVAHAFVQEQPPRAAPLDLYGADFPAFLESYAPAETLPYLSDVARLEWAVAEAARGTAEDEAPPSACAALPGIELSLAPSLRRLDTAYPAEAIWRAVLDDQAALDTIDPGRAPARLVIWRDGDGADVRALGTTSAAFIDALLGGADAEAALARAAAIDPEADAVGAISTEILTAPFARLTTQ